jgi:hypothetical protein
MGLFETLFHKRAKRSIQDPDFGLLEEREHGSWEGKHLELWGYTSIQIMIASTSEGPAMEHRLFIQALQSNRDDIRAKIESAIVQEAAKTTSHRALSSLSIFYLATRSQTWRVWHDVEGEDIMYGAEIKKWQASYRLQKIDDQRIVPRRRFAACGPSSLAREEEPGVRDRWPPAHRSTAALVRKRRIKIHDKKIMSFIFLGALRSRNGTSW